MTKFLVYNARKRQEGGDTPANYFHRTECVAGVQDARFQELMPDILLYFGVKKIHHLHSMSNMKYDAIVNSGIEVVNRLSIRSFNQRMLRLKFRQKKRQDILVTMELTKRSFQELKDVNLRRNLMVRV